MPAGITGSDGMMYTGAIPWHGLGVKLDNPATAEEAIKAAELDWEVETRSVYQYAISDTRQFYSHLEIPNKNAIVRKDTNEAFAIMSNGYEPVQNKDAFGFFDSVIGQGEAIYHTAGSLYGGRKVWILAKLPDDIVVSNQDREVYPLI
jgi:phage/plasmid-like protein (TIGR03299 family)